MFAARSLRRAAPVVVGSAALVLLPSYFDKQHSVAAEGVFGDSAKSKPSMIQPIK
jgi:hypothetical protein